MTATYDVKIFGERNTATNALERIVRRNSRSLPAPSVAADIDPAIRRRITVFNQFGRLPGAEDLAYRLREAAIERVFRGAPDSHCWKHAATRFDTAEAFGGMAVLFTVRHPASWVQSLARNPYHVPGGRPGSLEEFLDFRWPTVPRERLGGKSYRPLDLYAEKLRSYLDFFAQLDRAGIPWRLVHFETLVTDQAVGFATIADLLKEQAEQFEPIESSTKQGGRSLEEYRDYYGNERWRDEIGAAYDCIRGEFPETLAGEFGYRL